MTAESLSSREHDELSKSYNSATLMAFQYRLMPGTVSVVVYGNHVYRDWRHQSELAIYCQGRRGYGKVSTNGDLERSAST